MFGHVRCGELLKLTEIQHCTRDLRPSNVLCLGRRRCHHLLRLCWPIPASYRGYCVCPSRRAAVLPQRLQLVVGCSPFRLDDVHSRVPRLEAACSLAPSLSLWTLTTSSDVFAFCFADNIRLQQTYGTTVVALSAEWSPSLFVQPVKWAGFVCRRASPPPL